MSRQGSKTYRRRDVGDNASSRAFDQIFSPKGVIPTAAKAQVHKWGKTSYTSKRDVKDVEGTSANGNALRNVDPFSFESEEDSPKKGKGRGRYSNIVIANQSVPTIPIEANVRKTRTSPRKTPVTSPNSYTETVIQYSDIDDHITVKKPVKTYSRTPKTKPVTPVVQPLAAERANCDNKNYNLEPPTTSEQLDVNYQDIAMDTKTFEGDETISKIIYKERRCKSETKDLFDFDIDFDASSESDTKEKDNTEKIDDLSDNEVKLCNRYKTRRSGSSISSANPTETVTIIRVSPPSWYSKKKTESSGPKPNTNKDTLSNEEKMKLMQKEIDELLEGEDIDEETCDPPASKQRKFFRSRNRESLKIKALQMGKGSGKPAAKTKSSKISNITPTQGSFPVISDKGDNSDIRSESDSSQVSLNQPNYPLSLHDIQSGPLTESAGTTSSTIACNESSNACVTDDSGTCENMQVVSDISEADDIFSCIGNVDSQLSEDKLPSSCEKSQDCDSGIDNQQTSCVESSSSSKASSECNVTTIESPDCDIINQSQEGKRIFTSKNGNSYSQNSSNKRIFCNSKKVASKVSYNVRTWHGDNEGDDTLGQNKKDSRCTSVSNKPEKDLVGRDRNGQLISREVHWPSHPDDDAITSLHVKREHKNLFTVVRNVKQAYECQESGETQDFNQDIEYLLSGLPSTEPLSNRCLSCISFGTKCLLPAFRMHLRAHGIYTTIFTALGDAPSYPTLGLCTSLLLLMMSRDRINIEIDRHILTLMLELLGVDTDNTSQQSPTKSNAPPLKEYQRTLDRVKEILEKLRTVDKTRKIDVDDISPGSLAMEALLSLTGKHSGTLLKDELRTTGALDHIVDTVCHSAKSIEDVASQDFMETNVELLCKVERCLRVLENATYSHAENASYLIFYNRSKLVQALSRILETCVAHQPNHVVVIDRETQKVDREAYGSIILTCILSVLKVLLNATHDNALASTAVGKQEQILMDALSCVVSIPSFVYSNEQFDLLVLGLGLLINLSEHCEINRRLIFMSQVILKHDSNLKPPEKKDSITALIELFQRKEEAARLAEERGDLVPNTITVQSSQPIPGPSNQNQDSQDHKNGRWKESHSGLEWVAICEGESEVGEDLMDQSGSQDLQVLSTQDEDDDFTKALHRAGRHMEDSIVAAYVAILIGCLIQGNMSYIEVVRDQLPEEDFTPMIKILKKFYGFVSLTSAISSSGNKSIERVIEILESC